MKILVVNTHVPFVRGGAEALAENLNSKLKDYGHQSEMVNIPFKWYPNSTLVEQAYLNRFFDLSSVSGEKVDLIIPLKFPVYLIPHERKVVWLLHQHRQVYDLWETKFSDVRQAADGLATREFIQKADLVGLSEAKKIYTLSDVVTNRLKKYNAIESTPLYNPPPDEDKFYCDDKIANFFFPSRITSVKRQDLVVEAMRYTKTPVKVNFAGKPDNAEYDIYLKKKVAEYDLSKKINFLGEISIKEKIENYASCLGVIFPPVDEDYGYVTLEAMLSRKPVITCVDSGGPLEFIDDNKSGFIVDADPEKIAEKLDYLYENKALAIKMGDEAYNRYMNMKISWENVIIKLVNES